MCFYHETDMLALPGSLEEHELHGLSSWWQRAKSMAEQRGIPLTPGQKFSCFQCKKGYMFTTNLWLLQSP